MEDRLYLAHSTVEGQGVFTRQFISAGRHVVTCRGIILDRNDVTDYMRVMQVGRHTYLAEDANNPSVDDFLNHNCEPNLGFVDGSLTLYALRDILRGEELCFNYSTCMNERGWAMKCKCRSLTCRGRVQSYCDLARQERIRLQRIALAYLRPANGSKANEVANLFARTSRAANGKR